MTELLTITELARRSGITSRTIRFWSDAGLIPVARRSRARYRLYDAEALSRLELVHTLRELGLGLEAITQILQRDQTLAQAATTHIAAIDARMRALKLQRAVLHVVVRRAANAEETQLMHKLIHTSMHERRRIVEEFVTRAFADIPESATGASIAHALRRLPPELPEQPSDAEVEAWLELASMLIDPAFTTRVREMALAGAAAHLPQPFDIAAVREHAGAALAADVSPASPAAEKILERMLANSPPLSAAERSALGLRLESYFDVRLERYWQLMGVLIGRPPLPAIAAACTWFSEALRAHSAPRT